MAVRQGTGSDDHVKMHICAVPTIDKVEEGEKVRVEIISGSTWQTLQTFELDLLSPLPESIEISR